MTPEKTVDCRGLACPQPVIETKKALDEISGGAVIIIVDNDTARENITLFAKNAGCAVAVEETGGGYRITINKPVSQPAPSLPENGRQPLVYLFASNMFGEGPPELGHVLMKSLIMAINDLNPPPQALLFLNSGVFLTCDGSAVSDLLNSLESKSVQIISCGTCLEYYKLKDKLKCGRVGNMLEINNHLTGKAKAITIA